MLDLLEQYSAGGMTIELFQTHHMGPDYHVRYGLQVTSHGNLGEARAAFDECVSHLRQSISPS